MSVPRPVIGHFKLVKNVKKGSRGKLSFLRACNIMLEDSSILTSFEWQIRNRYIQVASIHLIQEIIDGFWIKATCCLKLIMKMITTNKKFQISLTRNSREANMSRVQRQS